jgi:hypothetical protein
MLRAHGLIQKVPKTHRYQVSPAGRLAISAVLTTSEASLSLLNGRGVQRIWRIVIQRLAAYRRGRIYGAQAIYAN